MESRPHSADSAPQLLAVTTDGVPEGHQEGTEGPLSSLRRPHFSLQSRGCGLSTPRARGLGADPRRAGRVLREGCARLGVAAVLPWSGGRCGGGSARGGVGSGSAESEACAGGSGGGVASLRSGKGAGGGRLLPAEATPGEPAAALFPLCPPPGGRCRPNAAKLGKEQSGPGQGRLRPERPPEHPRPPQPRGLSAPPARWPLPALGPPAALSRVNPDSPSGFLSGTFL